MQDILLDENNDLIIRNGDFQIGDSLSQEVSIILGLAQGELKSDPLLGPNLTLLMNSKANKTRVQTRVKLHLKRDGKDYEQIKKMIKVNATAN